MLQNRISSVYPLIYQVWLHILTDETDEMKFVISSNTGENICWQKQYFTSKVFASD